MLNGSQPPKIVVSLSGGMDSATVLGWVMERTAKQKDNRKVLAISFNYGSKHNPHELRSAVEVASFYRIEQRTIDLQSFMGDFKSALTSKDQPVPHGHYAEENMRQTVVPNRNMIMTSILVGIAESEGYNGVALGVHAGDHHIYPDCRASFVQSLRGSILLATEDRVMLYSPFIDQTKEGILRVGYEMGVPYERTRTCYEDTPIACGKCGSCQERLEAFALIGKDDPIQYQSRELIKK